MSSGGWIMLITIVMVLAAIALWWVVGAAIANMLSELHGAQRERCVLDISELGTYERRVLERMRDRLRVGQENYGPLKPISDARNWNHEALEEAIDLCVYLQAECMRRTESAK